MNQLEHGNIIPCYGVSTTVADICLVYPWYENGNIADYLKKNPDVNRFDLVSTFRRTSLLMLTRGHEQLSGAANGLRFAHENNIGCGFLRPVRGVSFSSTRVHAVDRVTCWLMTAELPDWKCNLRETSTNTGTRRRKSHSLNPVARLPFLP